MGSLPNKISEPGSHEKTATFERSIVYSALFHVSIVLLVLGFNKFNVSIFKKPPPQATVMWSQTVKRPTPTIKDKLPPPLVPMKKAEEPVKKDEINIKKEPEVKTKEESAKDRMKKALDAMKSKTAPEDDRPAPKEDNFATAEDNKQGLYSDTEVMGIQNSSEFGAYQALIKQTVNDNFIWYKPTNSSTLVQMKLDPQGNVTNLKIVKSSGDVVFDQAVLRAIQRSSPLPLPTTEKILKYVLYDDFEFNFERKNQ